MNGMNIFCLRAALLAAPLIFGTAAMSPGGVPPSAPNIAALRKIEKGQWELRDRDADRSARPKRLCVNDPSQLLQVKHGDNACKRFVVADTATHAVVTYQCRNSGNGRTDIRVETPRLVQIDSQGVADGAPYALSLEGRRTGDCRPQ